MKKIIASMVFAACVSAAAIAEADVNININLNGIPDVSISDNASVVLIPDTPDVYFVADSSEDIFFWNGMWWRSWQGKWFKSENSNGGWQPYNKAPEFYSKVNPHWKQNYKAGKWNGKPWKYKKVPQGQMKKEHSRDKNEQQEKGNGKGHKKDK